MSTSDQKQRNNVTDDRKSVRLHGLDALRAFAMLLGLLLHAAMSFVPLPPSVNAAQDIYQQSPVYAWLMDSIHGFRMPLFFLISGFFTAMLWQRRGAWGLVRQRALRIGVPLAVGLITLIPCIFAINILAARNIWRACTVGDVDYVESFIAAGRNLEIPLVDDFSEGKGGTPLHLAASTSNHAIAQLLLENHVEPNVKTAEFADPEAKAASPLHWAAYASDVDMLKLLVLHGAKVNPRDAEGATPVDYAAAAGKQDSVAWLVAAGGRSSHQLKTGQGSDAGPAGSEETDSADVLRRPNWEDSRQSDFLGAWIRGSSVGIQLFALATFLPVFAHLWFLWYLLWLIALFLLAVQAKRMICLRWPMPPALFSGLLLFAWAIPATFLLQLPMVQGFGPDTASGIVPWPPSLAYYCLFFMCGAGMRAIADDRSEVPVRSYGWCLIIAGFILPVGIYSTHQRVESFWIYHLVSSLCAATYAWLMIAGLWGLFARVFTVERPRIRFVSDAAYWVYLIHLPIVQVLQVWMADWRIASPIKFVAICALTAGITFGSYSWFVRTSWIGTILHGRKERKRHARGAAKSPPELVTE